MMIKKDYPTDSVSGSGALIDSATGNPGNRGFTLIEVMIVVAIIGILAAIAFPGYQWVLQRSYTTEAKTNLTSLTLLLEQHRSVYGCYGRRTGTPPTCPTAVTAYAFTENDVGTPTTNTITNWLNFNPRMATDVAADQGIRYNYSINAGDNVTPPTFTVTAAPVIARGAQAGNLTINEAGGKTGWRRR